MTNSGSQQLEPTWIQKLTQFTDLAANTIVTINDSLTPDFISAVEENFPPEQSPRDWSILKDGLSCGYLTMHELRDKETGELLSARLLCNYVSRFRGDPSFALICYAVTPSAQTFDSHSESATQMDNISRRGKSKGYGTYLFQRSQELLRNHMPHAIGLIGECESATGWDLTKQRKQRLQWMSATGRLQIAEYSYQIPPLPETYDRKILVADRKGKTANGYLLITPFEKRTWLEGELLATIVEHIYSAGYGIDFDDPFMIERLSQIVREKKYSLKELSMS